LILKKIYQYVNKIYTMHCIIYKLEFCGGVPVLWTGMDRLHVGPTIVLHKNLECLKITGNGFSVWFKQMHIIAGRCCLTRGCVARTLTSAGSFSSGGAVGIAEVTLGNPTLKYAGNLPHGKKHKYLYNIYI